MESLKLRLSGVSSLLQIPTCGASPLYLIRHLAAHPRSLDNCGPHGSTSLPFHSWDFWALLIDVSTAPDAQTNKGKEPNQQKALLTISPFT